METRSQGQADGKLGVPPSREATQATGVLRSPVPTRTRPVRSAIVADHNFILATRDTGYRSPAAAVAELIDNALQADARHVDLFVNREEEELADCQAIGCESDKDGPNGPSAPTGERSRRMRIAVLDDGCGMNHDTLVTALQFGGSGRFNDRSGAGRFGMGLPNSSVSVSRRLEVYTWQRRGTPLFSYLDVDEIASGHLRHVPSPKSRSLPSWFVNLGSEPAAQSARPLTVGPSGTLVVWLDCDRLPYRRVSTVHAKLDGALGRLYRHLLRQGVRISINGQTVKPADPLLEWHPRMEDIGAASQFGEELHYELKVPGRPGHTSTARVRFSLLPVRSWAQRPLEERRDLGVIGGAGVSVIRAGREIDFGWHFMGTKRKENYDDWWRCEVRFDPALDEYFGVTHSKQGITPQPDLLAIMCPDVERIARTLNTHVRSEFARVGQGGTKASSTRPPAGVMPNRIPQTSLRRKEVTTGAAESASRREKLLPPTCMRLRGYRIASQALSSPRFFEVRVERETMLLTLNSNHPFHQLVYSPAVRSDGTRYHFECMLLAAARAELASQVPARRGERTRLEAEATKRMLQKYCEAWSDALAAFVGARR
jgi:hypothetical protein